MEQISNRTVSEFVERFEAMFGGILLSAGKLPPMAGKKPPVSTNHFDICIAEGKFSDWDLDCYADPCKITLADLESMDAFVKAFPGFQCVKNFTGNRMPQFMTFMPAETVAPFFDLHIKSVPPEMIDSYFSTFGPALHQATADWLFLTWWRKLKKGDQENADNFRRFWIRPPFVTSQECDELRANPLMVLKERFKAKTDYAAAVAFLS